MRTHRFALAAAIGVGALAMTAGAGPAVAAEHAAAAQTSSPHGWQRCVNTAENYTIGYPGDWYTTQIRPEEVCAQIHPDRFVIPPESEYPLTALNVRRITALPNRSDTEFERTLLWQRTTVAGRPAVRFETVSTGAGMDLKGTKRYGYAIRLGHALISVHTAAAPGETRYAAWRKVVNRAARTLTAATPPGHRSCAPIRPETSYYEAGRVGTEQLSTPVSRCTTISVSNIRDPRVPGDHCQTFFVGFWPIGPEGSLTYTDRVEVCAASGEKPVVIATNVPDGARFIVLYQIDYIDPVIQTSRFRIWR